MKNKKLKYDVALSFAGEDRVYVERVAQILEKADIKVFYDKNEDLWGKDKYKHLDEVYLHNSKYTVVFISKNYAKKLWTNHELKSAQARAFKENEEYILPVIFDDTEIPGIRKTIGYEDARNITPEQLCKKILIKLKKAHIERNDEESIITPKIKRKITDLEKENFLKESILIIKEYFEKALYKFKSVNKDINTSIDEFTPSKFVTKIYINGDLKSVCKIWIGSGVSFDGTISYLEGNKYLDTENNNAINDYATLEENGIDIYFKISGMGFGISTDSFNRERASAKELAIYFWERFINNII